MNMKKKPKIPYKFSSRLIFSDTLPRISRIIEDDKRFENMIMSTDLPYVFSDDNTPIKFTYNLNRFSVYNSYANATWLLTNEKIKTPINLSFNITENTLENTVLVIVELSFLKRELIPLEYTDKIISIFPKISAGIISNMDKLLKEDKKDIYHYQSKIFNYSIEKIFDIFINIPKILSQRGVISSLGLDNEETIKEGSILRLIFTDGRKEINMKINKVKRDENNSKWELEILTLNDECKEAMIEFKFIKIGDEKTLVCIINKFLEHIESDVNAELNLKKKETFNFVEEELKIRFN